MPPSDGLCNRLVLVVVLVQLATVPVNAQFGEIASIVTGLLGSGAGLGSLGGLAGAGAAAGSAGAAGAAGAANALGSVGQLYQLAQAALQLTGTGVGIVNQASESAWFPAAVENAARMNRELQDRILAQQKNGGGAGGLGGGGGLGAGGLPDLLGIMPKTAGVGTAKEIDELGGEFGKEFGSHETPDETENKEKETETKTKSEEKKTEGSEKESSGGQVPLPGLVSLLPGESLGSTHEEEETPVAEVETTEAPAISPAEEKTQPAQPSPRITVEFPEDHDEFGEVKKPAKPNVEFSVDSGEENFPLIPPRAASPNSHDSVELPIDEKDVQTMVPELKKLIHALRKSNLTRLELMELTKQLEGNHEIGTPRENTTPTPTDLKTPLDRQPENELEQQEQDARKKAVNRNLSALRKALDAKPELRDELAHLMRTSPVIIKLPRPMLNGEVVRKKPQEDSARAFAARQVSMLPRRFITTTQSPVGEPVKHRNVAKAAPNRKNVSPYPIPTTTAPVTVTFPPTTTTQSYAQYQQAYQRYYQQYYGQQQPHYFSHLAAPQLTPQQPQNLFGQPQQPYYSHYYQHQQALQPQPFQYNTQQTYQQPQQQFFQQPQQPQQQLPYNSQRAFPARTVAPPVVTPAPLLLQHPWSQGSLLTVPQPHDNGK
ncbi:unnamed protein product [Bursaphelenchus xylophilus]|uniref:(pine wood nematode) hypothetical protein n=1 Tax=Bursaphelenchus xylophilus TaxID=6326 RepID=A0A1I7SLT8_BURXY|nr:unnamed protein product [Bursaphelenchus xylophilus]CAG9129832.1 unnamed protein product [Bursaphelenchus xylophilus]